MPAVLRPTFCEAVRFWLKLGLISFGGPAGQIAIMHQELVERRRWIEESHFLHALNYCMFLPGPEATQLAIYIGWLLHRTWGGIVAGVLFVLPSAAILWALSWVYAAYGDVPVVAALFYGLKPAVMAIVAAAVLRIGSRALKTPAMWSLAGLAWGAIALPFLHAPFPMVIFGAGLLGLVGGKLWPAQFVVIEPAPVAAAGPAPTVLRAPLLGSFRQEFGRVLRVALSGTVLWAAPLLVALAVQSSGGVFFQQGLFFSKAALVTFGGAYAVLPYVSQQAVTHFHWLSAGQMLDGLGLAETTPGPLIMVLEFVGFLGAWRHPGGLSSLLAATLGAAITVWATFVPCFIWILLGAPHVERMRGNARISAALSAITAAVVGVILNLAIWFGGHVLWPNPSPGNGGGLDFFALALGAAIFAGLTRWKWNLPAVVAGSALLGGAWRLLAI